MYLVLLSFPFRINQYEVSVLYMYATHATPRTSIVLIRVRVMLIDQLHVHVRACIESVSSATIQGLTLAN
jgi:hypothetical protein